MIIFNIMFGFFMMLIVAVCYILTIAFTVWMAVDAGKQDRFWWLAVIIGVPVIGPAAYYVTEKKHEYRPAPVRHLHSSETEEQHEKAPKKRVVRKVKKEIITEVPEAIKSTEIVQEVVENKEINNSNNIV
jgi:hypothetical protein